MNQTDNSIFHDSLKLWMFPETNLTRTRKEWSRSPSFIDSYWSITNTVRSNVSLMRIFCVYKHLQHIGRYKLWKVTDAGALLHAFPLGTDLKNWQAYLGKTYRLLNRLDACGTVPERTMKLFNLLLVNNSGGGIYKRADKMLISEVEMMAGSWTLMMQVLVLSNRHAGWTCKRMTLPRSMVVPKIQMTIKKWYRATWRRRMQ